MANEIIKKAYEVAKEQYAALGIDTDKVIEKMKDVVISLHCWQTDDVGGFETPDAELGGGGIQTTGNYPGKAGSIAEMRQDLDKAMSLLPGKQRLNLHAIYGDFAGEFVERNEIEVKHFQGWIDWAKERGMGLDFNATFFSHPKSDDGFSLSSKNEEHRQFWVEHLKRCRAIGAEMGKQLGTPCVHNTWVHDGSKDTPIDRNGYREILKKSLDEAFSVEYPKEHLKDAVESKLFGIGAESMTVGSHDFYLGYAIKNNKLICLDNGHFHPTEQVGDKISACLNFVDEVLLHVTRPVRWDSDHVVTLNEDIQLIASEIVRNEFLNRVNIGLDFFDASINRIGAYVTGTRAAQKAFMIAMLEPTATLVEYEEEGKNFERLALLEELKTKPFGAVWDYYCMQEGVPVSEAYIADIQQYEKDVLSKR
ncbi:L-rhamnose isomerase [Carboxylicivirga linearis]|uniref:L-rhamnose isomerase n=1 Tax=Carboxylicivirga linearis TaxID=1628157 RepID=A0ABS5JTC1_9BACT|nr:L-rhamnose isomerase [Carboxylicivirga linearis]MBS2098107.1 L-rhamnose isomerase [Carboxylicivirga linearis]